MVNYAGDALDPHAIPPEWMSWLRKTRADPPNEQDLDQGNAARQAQRRRAEAADAAAAEAAMRWQQQSSDGSSTFTQQVRTNTKSDGGNDVGSGKS